MIINFLYFINYFFFKFFEPFIGSLKKYLVKFKEILTNIIIYNYIIFLKIQHALIYKLKFINIKKLIKKK